MRNYQEFFGRDAEVVANELVGRLIARSNTRGITAAQIREVGAYQGGKITPRREGMLYVPGTIFLMPFRGFRLLNIATNQLGIPSCVEIRRISFHDREIAGSGAISNFLDIPPEFDRMPLGEKLQILGKQPEGINVSKSPGTSDNCLGYFFI